MGVVSNDADQKIPGFIFPAEDVRAAYEDIERKFLYIVLVRGRSLYCEKIQGIDVEVMRVFTTLAHAEAYKGDQEEKSTKDLIVRRLKLATIWEAVDAVQRRTRTDLMRIELSRVYDGDVWSIDLLAGPGRVLH